MIDFLINIDIKLFLFLNSFHSEFFDSVMMFLTGKYSWILLYISILIFVFKKFGAKSSFIIIFLFIFTTILTDQTSVHLFKDVFKRLRPCFNPLIADIVHVVKYPGGQYGFVSSHAANAFGTVVLASLILRNKYISILLIFWASVIAYSRIYLGVHFPGDVLVGALLGTFWAFVIYYLFKYFDKKKKTNSILA
jgi:undecaprenyl-diphosphatase